MSTITYQHTETTTIATLKLKLAAPPLPPPAPFADLFSSTERHSLYTNPYDKNTPFSILSPKSLELCTETLGSESGTGFSNSGEVPASTHFDFHHEEPQKRSKSLNSNRSNECRKKLKDFPPPLTSSLQVRRRREEGRLIIEVAPVVRSSRLTAERSGGDRLRLYMVSSNQQQQQKEEEEIEKGMKKFGRTMNRCINGSEGLCSTRGLQHVNNTMIVLNS